MGKKEIIKELKTFKRDLKKKIYINKMLFFGSRASGKPKQHSDIDLIIVSKDFKGKRFRNRAIGFYNYWNLNYAVDFLCYTPAEFKRLSKQITIVSQAIKEGIEI